MRPAGLSSAIDEDRIVTRRADRVATLDDAKPNFQKSWDAWKAWAKLEEVP